MMPIIWWRFFLRVCASFVVHFWESSGVEWVSELVQRSFFSLPSDAPTVRVMISLGDITQEREAMQLWHDVSIYLLQDRITKSPQEALKPFLRLPHHLLSSLSANVPSHKCVLRKRISCI